MAVRLASHCFCSAREMVVECCSRQKVPTRVLKPENRLVPGSGERRDSRNRAAQGQRVYVVRAFVGIDRFQIHHVTDHVKLI